MIISKNAEKVEKTPNFSGSKPNPGITLSDSLIYREVILTGSSGEIASLNDTGLEEDLGVLGMDDLQTGRTLQVTCLRR